MANNKVQLSDGTTIIDLSTDTVTSASHIKQGLVGHLADGTAVTGTLQEGITPSGTIDISDEGTYDVTNYASAVFDIDYTTKTRAVTFVVNRQDTTSTYVLSVYNSFGTNPVFTNGISTTISTMLAAVGEATHTYTAYIPRNRPIIVIRTANKYGNFDVSFDSTYGEVIDVPHITGASDNSFSKAIFLKSAAPDQFTITITPYSTAQYPDTVLLGSLTATANGTYTPTSGSAYSSVNVNVPVGEDMPTFTNLYDSSQYTETTTCDKTYLDCVNNYPKAKLIVTDSPETYYYTYYLEQTYNDPSKVIYTSYEYGRASQDIIYYSDGHIEIDVSWCYMYLEVTRSGAYEPDKGAYFYVDVPAGTMGTPTATKGAVTNHIITVTPSVTNTAGYINGGTVNGTGVQVTASELVSGTYTVTSAGTKDVTTYASVSIPTGTARTPTATKGTVSNHSVTVTPSVTNTAGYITGGTLTGTGVSVSASELVSGSQTITENGTVDVTNLASVDISVQAASNAYTRTEILATQSFTPSSSNKRATLTGLIEGFTDGGDYIVTYDGTEWLVTCETLWSNNYTIGQAQYFLTTNSFDSTEPFGIIWMSGTTCTIAVGDTSQHTVKIEKLIFDGGPLTLVQKTITESGTYNAADDNADGYSSVTVDISSGGGMNVQMYNDYDYSTATTYSATDVTLTVAKTGTYDISWVGWRNTTSGTSGSQLYKNGTAYGSANTTFQGSYGQSVNLTGVTLNAGDVLVVHARARSTSYRMYVANLVIVQTA